MVRMIAAGVAGVFFCAALIFNNQSIDAANAEALDNETIMKKLNRKKDNEGVHYKVKLQLEAADIAWDVFAKNSKEYAELTSALAKNKATKGAPDSWEKLCKSYAADAKALSDAADKKDKTAAATAFEKLTKSCQACHDEHR